MGNLPARRVQQCRPFLHSTVDYAGPVWLRTAKGRGYRAYKGFIAVFVCNATHAVHLEAVSDCSTSGFLAAFCRFTARRGICASLTSDQGRNFIGADAELRALFKRASAESETLENLLASDGTQWHFSPPGAPHFNGLAEAAVKSAKHHLCRVIGDTKLTFEEMSTFLAQVEACLNSRPIQALTDDAMDLCVLTPGHFLIGDALTTIPEPSLSEIPSARLSRWQLTRQMYEHFWKRWQLEYLQALQQRGKWKFRGNNVKIGDLGLIKAENVAPAKWPLARVLDVHPGPEGAVRVITLKTATTTLQRPVTKFVPLLNVDPAVQ